MAFRVPSFLTDINTLLGLVTGGVAVYGMALGILMPSAFEDGEEAGARRVAELVVAELRQAGIDTRSLEATLENEKVERLVERAVDLVLAPELPTAPDQSFWLAPQVPIDLQSGGMLSFEIPSGNNTNPPMIRIHVDSQRGPLLTQGRSDRLPAPGNCLVDYIGWRENDGGRLPSPAAQLRIRC